jgi:hypothetical protein
MEELIMNQQSIEGIVRLGLENLMRHALELWPRQDEQILERNLSFYVGAALLERGFTIIQEWPCGRAEHFDMVAFHPQESTLLVTEAKRLWAVHGDEDAVRVRLDVDRINRIIGPDKSLPRWSYSDKTEMPLAATRVFGVALASVSGAGADEAKKHRERLAGALAQQIGEFSSVPHEDGTYIAFYRVWTIK